MGGVRGWEEWRSVRSERMGGVRGWEEWRSERVGGVRR